MFFNVFRSRITNLLLDVEGASRCSKNTNLEALSNQKEFEIVLWSTIFIHKSVLRSSPFFGGGGDPGAILVRFAAESNRNVGLPADGWILHTI